MPGHWVLAQFLTFDLFSEVYVLLQIFKINL